MTGRSGNSRRVRLLTRRPRGPMPVLGLASVLRLRRQSFSYPGPALWLTALCARAILRPFGGASRCDRGEREREVDLLGGAEASGELLPLALELLEPYLRGSVEEAADK